MEEYVSRLQAHRAYQRQRPLVELRNATVAASASATASTSTTRRCVATPTTVGVVAIPDGGDAPDVGAAEHTTRGGSGSTARPRRVHVCRWRWVPALAVVVHEEAVAAVAVSAAARRTATGDPVGPCSCSSWPSTGCAAPQTPRGGGRAQQGSELPRPVLARRRRRFSGTTSFATPLVRTRVGDAVRRHLRSSFSGNFF